MKNITILTIAVFFLSGISSCKKFVEVPAPVTQLITNSVFTDDGTATSAINGIYSNMMVNNGFESGGPQSFTVIGGLSSDELTNYSSDANQTQFAVNLLNSGNATTKNNFWADAYQNIFYSNSALEGLRQSTGLTPSVKNELAGEAYFIRAFCYFYLTSLFGNVPLNLSTNYQTTSLLPRSSSDSVQEQILSDLLSAEQLLSADYSLFGGERVRPNQFAARALRARVFMYRQQWDSAVSEASAVIGNTTLYNLVMDPNLVFLANSTEAIWQFDPVQPGYNTQEATVFILTSDPVNVAVSSTLLNAFESGDQRKAKWLGSFSDANGTWYYPFKYKIAYGAPPVAEYSMVLRLAEQYLIRGEALAHIGSDLPSSAADLNIIRNRAGLVPITAGTQSDLLAAFQHERQVEMFCEWGHRWLDLIRSGNAAATLTTNKGIAVSSTSLLYPIPQTELQNDPNLVQNPGY